MCATGTGTAAASRQWCRTSGRAGTTPIRNGRGMIGVTASHIHDMPSCNPENPPAARTAPFRIEGSAGGAPDGAGRPARARDAR